MVQLQAGKGLDGRQPGLLSSIANPTRITVGMNAGHLERLREQLTRLCLAKGLERLEALLQEATDKEWSYVDFLDQLFTEALSAKIARNIIMRTHMARSRSSKAWSLRLQLPAFPWVKNRSATSSAATP